MMLQVIYVVLGLIWLFLAFFRQTRGKIRKRIFMVILAVSVEGLFFIIQITGIPGTTEYYDVSMIGYLFGMILLFIAICSFDLLGTTDIAKEFVIDRISEGIIAVDNAGVIQYYNEPAAALYPGLTIDPFRVLEEIDTAIKDDQSITINGRIYTPEENDLFYGKEVVGKIYALMDDTEHYRYMEELEEQRRSQICQSSARERDGIMKAMMGPVIRTV